MSGGNPKPEDLLEAFAEMARRAAKDFAGNSGELSLITIGCPPETLASMIEAARLGAAALRSAAIRSVARDEIDQMNARLGTHQGTHHPNRFEPSNVRLSPLSDEANKRVDENVDAALARMDAANARRVDLELGMVRTEAESVLATEVGRQRDEITRLRAACVISHANAEWQLPRYATEAVDAFVAWVDSDSGPLLKGKARDLFEAMRASREPPK
jgi:hypothetical protein